MTERKIFVLNDEFIAQLQNIVIYCMATGTHVVDSVRQMRLEESSTKSSTLVLTPEYLEFYEKTIEKLKEELTERAEKHEGSEENQSPTDGN